MARFEHFLHPHKLSFHNNLEGTQLTCTGCKFPCTGTPVYSCHPCNFFLHSQCFNAPRSLILSSHPDHPLSLFPFPTYTYGSFICNSCNKSGSGFCFCCPTCQFDLHIHCAYNDLKKTKPHSNPSLNQIRLKAHANHLLHYLPKVPYASRSCLCDVCGTYCDPDSPLYHCDICGYDAHVGCANLPETVQREDHEHVLSLLHVNPYVSFECDVCRDLIAQKNCMYLCKSGCDYGMHVKCVKAKVSEKTPMSERMTKLNEQLQVNQMMLLALNGVYIRN